VSAWDRRAAEWTFQLQTATLELGQIEQQLNAANFRVQIATRDLDNQDLQNMVDVLNAFVQKNAHLLDQCPIERSRASDRRSRYRP
jgi:hypothetical protein